MPSTISTPKPATTNLSTRILRASASVSGGNEGGSVMDESAEKNQEPVSVVVDEAHQGIRLDQFLANCLEGPSRNRLKGLIKQGAVARDGATIEDPSYKVKLGERYVVDIPPPVPATPKPQAIPLDVVYEDADLIVVNKPAGMVVHPAAGNWSKTLVNALLHHCGDSLSGIGGVLRPGIVHRLDKATSGLLVVAKNDAAHAGLRAQFSDHSLERAYKAVVWGAPRPLVGTIDAPIARGGADRQKMVIVRPQESREGKSAVTHYKVLERYGALDDPAASMVECRLETGRTHQIRVHMAHIGHPLLGDPTYGQGRRFLSEEAAKGQAHVRQAVASLTRQALHAYVLGFEHPISGKMLRFESELPKDLRKLHHFLELL